MRKLAALFVVAIVSFAFVTGTSTPATAHVVSTASVVSAPQFIGPAEIAPMPPPVGKLQLHFKPPPPPPPVVRVAPPRHYYAPPPPVSYPSGVWQALVMSLPWNGSLMLRIIYKCESGGNPTAQNPYSTAHGLFQELGEWTSDPIQQVHDAYALWLVQGYGAWSSSESCWG